MSEVYETAPLGSLIVPFREAPDTDLEALGRGFRGRRGRVLLRESVHVQAAGGAAPSQDWRPAQTTPDISKAMTAESLDRARGSIMAVFGVLPAMFDKSPQGPLIREAQRHLASWMLQPIAAGIAEEAGDKLGLSVTIDIMRPLQAFDTGGRARALSATLQAIATAKAGGVGASEIDAAAKLVDWEL